MGLLTILDSLCALAASLTLWCMLQEAFKDSGRAFRWSVMALSGSLAVSGVAPWLWGDEPDAPTLMVHASLALMVGLIRLKQTQPAWYACLEARATRLAERVRSWRGSRA